MATRKPYNKGYKVLKMDRTRPFEKVGEMPSSPDATAKSMMKSQFKRSPQGAAKLKTSTVP